MPSVALNGQEKKNPAKPPRRPTKFSAGARPGMDSKTYPAKSAPAMPKATPARSYPDANAFPSAGTKGVYPHPKLSSAAPAQSTSTMPNTSSSSKNPGVGTAKMDGDIQKRGGVTSLQTRFQRDSGLAMNSRKK